jgi:hypothetical protein
MLVFSHLLVKQGPEENHGHEQGQHLAHAFHVGDKLGGKHFYF